MWASLVGSIRTRFGAAPPEVSFEIVTAPFTIELRELATAVWLPHNQTPVVVVSGPTEAVVPVSVPPVLSVGPTPVLAGSTLGVAPVSPVGEGAGVTPTTLPASAPVSSRSRYGLQDFLQAFVLPHESVLRMQLVYDPLVSMLQFLDQHGDGPSLVVLSPERDHEAGELFPVRQALLRVTLKDHTYHVADFALKILKDTYRDAAPLIPKVLVAALGHDLGKAPELRTATVYTMGDHTAASAVQVQKCFHGVDVPWLNEAINAIVAHHRGSKEPLDVLLKQADERARQYELSQQDSGVRVQPFEQWCQLPALLQLVSLRVNVIKRSNLWEALSFKDVVYVLPEALLEAARQLAKREGVVELGLVRSDDREPMLRRLVALLRTHQSLGEEVGEGYYGRYYQLVMAKRSNTKRLYLIPIKKEAFGEVQTQFEGRKDGLLSLVTDVRHVR